MSETTYLITGANRGLGKGVLDALVARPNTIVIAAVRDVTSALQIFSTVPVGENSKIITVKIDSASETDPSTAVSELKTTHNITKLDVLISNAGLLEDDAIIPVLETSSQSIRDHINVNTIGPLLLFKAFHPLLLASSNPRFFALSSVLGSIGALDEFNMPFFSYGISKVAVNYFVRKVAIEIPEIISVSVHPGWIQTGMGNTAAKGVGMNEAPVSYEDGVRHLVTLYDGVKKEQSGCFVDAATGGIVPW